MRKMEKIKRIIIGVIFIVLMIPMSVMAKGDISGSVFFSNDTDDLNIVKSTISGTYYPDIKYFDMIGASFSDIRVDGKDFNYNGTRESILFSLISKDGKTKLYGDIGGTFISNHSYLTGDLTLTHKFNDNISTGLTVVNDFVDNYDSIDIGVQATTVAGEVNIDYDRYFASIVGGTTYFSDNNYRPFIKTKFGVTVVKDLGLSLYGKTYNYQNEEPYHGHYFAPNHYERYLAGVQLRKVFNGFLVNAHVDYGVQVVDGQNFDSYSYGIGVKKFVTENVSIGADIETSQFQPDYRYTSGFIKLIYYF